MTELDAYLVLELRSAEIAARRREVRGAILEKSPHVREPQFSRISPRDLAIAFERYDALFFGASIRAILGHRPLTFRLSTRATSRGSGPWSWG